MENMENILVTFNLEANFNNKLESTSDIFKDYLALQISKIIENSIASLESKIETETKSTENEEVYKVFNNSKNAKISFIDYIRRIIKLSSVEPSTLICSLVLVNRLISYNKSFKLTKNNIFKVYFAAVLVSIKMNEDEIYNYNIYSKIAGISSSSLSQLENSFLGLLKYSAYVSQNEFNFYLKNILKINNNHDINNNNIN